MPHGGSMEWTSRELLSRASDLLCMLRGTVKCSSKHCPSVGQLSTFVCPREMLPAVNICVPPGKCCPPQMQMKANGAWRTPGKITDRFISRMSWWTLSSYGSEALRWPSRMQRLSLPKGVFSENLTKEYRPVCLSFRYRETDYILLYYIKEKEGGRAREVGLTEVEVFSWAGGKVETSMGTPGCNNQNPLGNLQRLAGKSAVALGTKEKITTDKAKGPLTS